MKRDNATELLYSSHGRFSFLLLFSVSLPRSISFSVPVFSLLYLALLLSLSLFFSPSLSLSISLAHSENTPLRVASLCTELTGQQSTMPSPLCPFLSSPHPSLSLSLSLPLSLTLSLSLFLS